MFQVAGGILIAAFVLATLDIGLTIAFDRDNRNLGTSGPCFWMAGFGLAGGLLIIYMGLAKQFERRDTPTTRR